MEPLPSCPAGLFVACAHRIGRTTCITPNANALFRNSYLGGSRAELYYPMLFKLFLVDLNTKANGALRWRRPNQARECDPGRARLRNRATGGWTLWVAKQRLGFRRSTQPGASNRPSTLRANRRCDRPKAASRFGDTPHSQIRQARSGQPFSQ
jgi:hypothetical protein